MSSRSREFIPCVPKWLPADACPSHRSKERESANDDDGPDLSRCWPFDDVCLCVEFLDDPCPSLRRRILEHMNAWSQWGDVRFYETRAVGDIRISRVEDGHWSYVGTEIEYVHTREATMNLCGFTESTSAYELTRVVRHLAGLCLGLPHERLPRKHLACIDRERALEYFGRVYGWSRSEVELRVLTPLEHGSRLGCAAPSHVSVMSIQVPGHITRDGRPIVGGLDIHPVDGEVVAALYPGRQRSPGRVSGSRSECCDEPCREPNPPSCSPKPGCPDPPSGDGGECRPTRRGFDGVLYFAAGTDPSYVAEVIAAVESE